MGWALKVLSACNGGKKLKPTIAEASQKNRSLAKGFPDAPGGKEISRGLRDSLAIGTMLMVRAGLEIFRGYL